MGKIVLRAFAASTALAAAAAPAQNSGASPSLDEVRALRAELDRQAATIAAQRARLDALEEAYLAQQRALGAPQSANAAAAVAPAAAAAAGGTVPNRAINAAVANDAPVPTVGVVNGEAAPMPEVAALSDTGGIITRPGRITIEPGLEYARADRNRVIFRGIEVPSSVLVGVFDINESRQDIVTASLGVRYGITSRIEFNARFPFVYRNDFSVLAPASTGVARENQSSKGSNLGDIEGGFRYQLTSGRNGEPYLIAAVGGVIPTGTSPFRVRRDATGRALRSATGGGFWAVTPTVTALVPTDPAVLFATLGYTHNFGRSFDGVQIGDLRVDHVKPGDALLGTFGLGVSLNPRVAFSLGYAHNWAFGTRTRGTIRSTALVGASPTVTLTPFDQKLRDLQIGRLLFGVSYRTSPRTTINWNVEVGATQDAADVRTTLRVPFSFGG